MALEFAVDRLYEGGWEPGHDLGQRLEDGRVYPSVQDVRQAFEGEGLTLQIREMLMFGCWRAEWFAGEESVGTVVGNSEAEAAVYALAQLREMRVGV